MQQQLHYPSYLPANFVPATSHTFTLEENDVSHYSGGCSPTSFDENILLGVHSILDKRVSDSLTEYLVHYDASYGVADEWRTEDDLKYCFKQI